MWNAETDPAAQGERPLDPDATIEWIPALRAFARSLTRDATEADDLVQETLVKAIRNKEKFTPGTNLRAWLFTIMRNTFYNDRVKRGREHPATEECASGTPWLEPTQEWSLRAREVMDAVNRLPIHYREVFILVIMLGESYENSADICEIAVGTVKSRVNRARAMVIEELGDQEI